MRLRRVILSRSLARGERGAAALEFAIVLPILFSVVFGLWEFGRIFDAWLIATNAAREGARYAVISNDDNLVKNKVSAYLTGGYGPRLGLAGDVDIDVNDPAHFSISRSGSSGPATVVVNAAIDIYAPWLPILQGSNTFTVTAFASMRQ